MNTQFCFSNFSGIRAMPCAHAAKSSLALLVISALVMTAPAIAQGVESAPVRRYVDRANCFAGASSNDVAICLKEINAAFAAARQEKPIELLTHDQNSVSLRCQAPHTTERDACAKPMRGDGVDSGRIKDSKAQLQLAVRT